MRLTIWFKFELFGGGAGGGTAVVEVGGAGTGTGVVDCVVAGAVGAGIFDAAPGCGVKLPPDVPPGGPGLDMVAVNA